MAFNANAEKYRVNNTGGIDADYTDLQTAIDSASTGDTLYIEGSAILYGDITISKQLYLFGPGYFLTENDSTQANPSTASIDDLTISSGASGAFVTGLTMSWINISANNVTIKRNRIHGYGISVNAVTNCMILQNYIDCSYSSSAYSPVYVKTNASNIIISNNFLRKAGTTYPSVRVEGTSSAVITQNVIYNGVDCVNSNFTNNFIVQTNLGITPRNSSFDYNWIFDDADYGGTNIEGLSLVNVWDSTQTSTDKQWMLLDNSPASGVGVSGEDLGMYGGVDPYVPSGLPAIPAIFFYNGPSAGSEALGLPVTVKIKSHK